MPGDAWTSRSLRIAAQVLENCIMAVHECLEEYQGEGAPPKSYFENVRAGMIDALNSKHYKEGVGSWQGFMKLCQLRSRKVANGFWTVQRVDEMLLKFVSESETPGLMPTQAQVQKAKTVTHHSHEVTGMALCMAISKQGEVVYSMHVCSPFSK